MKRVTAVALLLGLSLSAVAAPYPKPIQSLIDDGLRIEKSFPAVSGLTGWVVAQNNRYFVVYTTADKKTLIAGNLIGEDGRDLSAVDAEKYVPAPDHSAAYQALTSARTIKEGKGGKGVRPLYVFFDPNCPYCQKLWQALQSYESAGLQVQWVPVAYLGPTSQPKAARMLASADSTAAFRAHMQRFGQDRTVPAEATASADVTQALERNLALMHEFGMQGTPALVWQDDAGQVRTLVGLPPASALPRITGLPAPQ
jgi:thiol:disulfide interchange protein DsbG